MPSLPPNHHYQPGDVIAGRLHLVRPLGKGGMGVVWIVHHDVLDVHLAVKMIDLQCVSKPQTMCARVLQEARAAARLSHPAICRVFDYGQTELGDPYVVTELLHGETLAELIKREQRMVATRAVALLLPIVGGLSAAHDKGIVHRDVKPENVFLSHDDVRRLQPKLLDFGIARFVEADHKLTQDGALLGTPHYMSPEQARGEADADVRTDVWSFCVLLYELISGRPPFDGENYNALLWAIGHDTPRSLAESGAADHGLWQLIERGLRKVPFERWTTLRDLGERLACWLHAQGRREDVCGASLRSTWLQGTAFDPGPDALTTDPDLTTLRAKNRPPADGDPLGVRIPGPCHGEACQVAKQQQADPRTSEPSTVGPEIAGASRKRARRSTGCPTGIFEKVVPPRGIPPRRRWLIGAVAVGLTLTLAALNLSDRTHTELNPALEREPSSLPHAGHVIREDLTLPLLMASEVTGPPSTATSSAATPEPESSGALRALRRRPLTSLRPPRGQRRMDPERYDLGF
ncbi:serine/threonine-protein kinase [Myxococcota bacterium]